MYNAVGIDVSKGKSTVAVLQPGGVIVRKPFDVPHTSRDFNQLISYISYLNGDTRVVMECTGRYHEPMANALSDAGLFVTIVNPHLIKDFGNNSLRKVKSDHADAKKIARYTLDNWADLRQYSCMDNTRTQLKTLNSQFSFFMKQKVAAKANLIALLESTLPEYETVMGMYGAGKTYDPQLIAEIGDVSRFTHREAITAFAGVDLGVNQSGQQNSKSNRASKCGMGRLRKTLFQIMTTLLQNAPANDPVYRFLDRKHSEGKPYHVYMTAGANKFLRIYYGKVKAHLCELEQSE